MTKTVLSMLLVLVLLASLCAQAAGKPSSGKPSSGKSPAAQIPSTGLPRNSQLGALRVESSFPEPYRQVIETYYNVFYADWYEALTESDLYQMGVSTELLELSGEQCDAFGYYLEDINGDGTDELFMGMNNDEYTEALYQIFTLINGELSCIYVSGDGSAAYLRTDGTLLYESATEDNDVSCFIYTLNGQGTAELTSGVMSTGGAWYTVANGNRGPSINEAQFEQTLTECEQGIQYIQYAPLKDWQFGNDSSDGNVAPEVDGIPPTGISDGGDTSEATEVAASGPSGYFTHQTLYNNNIPVANVLIPEGWSASVSVDWNFISTTTPGVAEVTLNSPDGHAAIRMISNQSYSGFTVNGSQVAEGVDMGLYTTNLNYRNAGDYQSLLLQALGLSDATLLEEYEVSDSMRQMAEDAAQVKLQSQLGSISTPLGCEGTVADRHYVSGDSHLECFSLVTMARSSANTGHVIMESMFWNIPFTYMLVTDSQEAYDQYHPLFGLVSGNSSFTMDFLFVVLTYGQKIDDVIHAGLMQQSYEYIMGDSGSWLSEYQSSSDYDSSKWAEGWSDVIKEQNEYVTTDGGHIKVDTKYDTVYQNGDQLYMGPEGQAPDGYGWERLELAR